MPAILPVNFPKYDLSLTLYQKKIIWKFFSEIQEFIEDYFIVHTQCFSNKDSSDIHAYIFLKENSDISMLSGESKKKWNLPLDKKYIKSSEFIILSLPESVSKLVYPNSKHIHYTGNLRCFHDYFP